MYVGGLDEKVSEPLLWELFLQAGPVVNTHMPKDRVTGQHQGEYPPGAPSPRGPRNPCLWEPVWPVLSLPPFAMGGWF